MRISDWSSDVCSSDLLDASNRAGEVGEVIGADADDHREDHDLDPRTDDVAQHPFGEERCAVPQCERHKDEAGEARELELQYRDEELDRENEESCNDDHPGDHEHRDLDEIDRKSKRMNTSH